MRFTAVIPVLFSVVALILTFLAMFAGSSKGFMDDYALVTMNTSRIGHNIFNTSQPTDTDDILLNIVHNITNSLGGFVEDAVNSIAKEIGLHDFYAAHLLTYCEGFYTPAPVPNASLSVSDIHQNITYCSDKTTNFYFNPTQVLQNELNQAGHADIQLKDLQWPSVVDEGFQQMRTAARVTFAFYCISIVLMFATLGLSIVGVFLEGRTSACANLSVGWSAFVAILVASAISTYTATKSTSLINQNLDQIGISASTGGKFLAITWATTGLVFVSSLVWNCICVVGRKKHKPSKKIYTSETKRV